MNKKLGVVGQVIIGRVASAVQALKQQAQQNLKVMLDSHLEEILSEVITEEFRDTFIEDVESAESSSYLSYSSQALGLYTYPILSVEHRRRKAVRYGYAGFKRGHPYKDKLYMQNRSESVLGALKTMASQADFGEKYLQNLGVSKAYSGEGIAPYSPDDVHYKRMAERKKAELARRSKVVV